MELNTVFNYVWMALVILSCMYYIIDNYNQIEQDIQYSIYNLNRTLVSPDEITMIKTSDAVFNGNYWEYLPITYDINENCPDDETERIEQAFNIIEYEVQALSFQPVEINKNADIKFFCSDKEWGMDSSFRTLGETTTISESNIITEANIKILIKKNPCKYPTVEVHEILHALDFNHVEDTMNLMYKIHTCKEVELPDKVVETLQKVYT